MTHLGRPAAMMVAVTGATGFIGARLTDMLLANGPSMRPRVLTRRNALQSSRTDLLDAISVRDGLAGCQAVVHCAFDFADLPVNLQIARLLGQQCVASRIRLVHVSTAAVYEPFPDGILDETGGGVGPGSDYKQTKLAIEHELLRQYRRDGLDVVILQPTVVYGPHGRAWTDSPIRDLLTGSIVLPRDGSGLCNAVFVDDVCRAVIAAITARGVSGERLLISGATPVTWRAFYDAYAAMLGLPAVAVSSMPDRPVPHPSLPLERDRPRRIKHFATRLLGAGRTARLALLAQFAAGLMANRRHRPTGPMAALLSARCSIRIEAARHHLNYEPQIGLEAGMRLTEPYVQTRFGRLARLRRLRG